MRPIGTQRPERPKSELLPRKYEKCGLSKASESIAYLRPPSRHTRSWSNGCGEARFPQCKSWNPRIDSSPIGGRSIEQMVSDRAFIARRGNSPQRLVL